MTADEWKRKRKELEESIQKLDAEYYLSVIENNTTVYNDNRVYRTEERARDSRFDCTGGRR